MLARIGDRDIGQRVLVVLVAPRYGEWVAVPRRSAALAGRLNQRFHVFQVLLQRNPSVGCDRVLGARRAPLEPLAVVFTSVSAMKP